MDPTQTAENAALLHLPTPDTFDAFPYKPPYAIQLELMKNLYASIEAQKVVILESPTGTGKTLSLLCGGMTWLKDDEARAKKGKLKQLEDSLQAGADEPAWVIKQTLELGMQEIEEVDRLLQERLDAARMREEALKRKEKARPTKRRRLNHPTQDGDSDDDTFLPEEHDAGGDDNYGHLPADVREMLKKYDAAGKSLVPVPVEGKEPVCTKIYYASRTHTQLAQTIGELGKTPFIGNTRTVSLGSRKNMCINDTLRAKGGDLDEACRELMAGRSEKRCPFMPPPDNETQMLDFRDHILATPRDIEDLVELGKELNTCPYYGSRRAIAQAELVTLPYNLLLQKGSREALGIDLSGHVVIIDEAHNLIDTILSIHTIPLSSVTLRASLAQLKIYLAKFKSRFSAQNAVNLRRLVLFLTSLDQFCSDWIKRTEEAGNKASEAMLEVHQFVNALGSKVQDVNLLEIDKYLRASKIARKIGGYCDKVAEREAAKGGPSQSAIKRRSAPPLQVVEGFLLALTTPSEDGRIFISLYKHQDGASSVNLKYQLLNPAEHFREVVESARSVVLAGGTMQPISDLETQLFAYLDQERFHSFSCGHVIPEENLKCVIVEKGPRGGDMCFRFDRRGDKAMLAELGQLLLNLINLIPDGVVVFFPSYNFLDTIKAGWNELGMMQKFSVKKTVFFEPQDGGNVELVLKEYAQAINSARTTPDTKQTGAILFAVVGAKLSEGLNFTDELARSVILVGLPFANLGSTELKERMKYVKELSKGKPLPPGAKDAGQELYENLCMKAVNQSIGRAIRHRGDWASLILVDCRYSGGRIRSKLPKWINDKAMVASTFGQVVKELAPFYARKKSRINRVD